MEGSGFCTDPDPYHKIMTGLGGPSQILRILIHNTGYLIRICNPKYILFQHFTPKTRMGILTSAVSSSNIGWLIDWSISEQKLPSPSPPRFPGQQREGTPRWRSSPPAQRSSHGDRESESLTEQFRLSVYTWNRMDQDGLEDQTSLLSLALAPPSPPPHTVSSCRLATSLPRIKQER